jgi:hypothetical protein
MAAILLSFSIKALPNRMAHLIDGEPLKNKRWSWSLSNKSGKFSTAR